MGKKKKRRRKFEKLLAKRGLDGEAPVMVVCVGKSCCDRKLSRELVREVREYAAGTPVRVEVTGCLNVCKKGPIVATSPDLAFHKRVTAEEAKTLVDELPSARARRS